MKLNKVTVDHLNIVDESSEDINDHTEIKKRVDLLDHILVDDDKINKKYVKRYSDNTCRSVFLISLWSLCFI